MRGKWLTERKWECTKAQQGFEDLLKENGYKILGYREYCSKTEYKVEKNGIEIEYAVFSDLKHSDTKHAFKCFVDYYNLKAEVIRLRELVSSEN